MDHRIRIIRDQVQSIAAWIKTRFFLWSLRDTGSKPDCYTFKSVREYEKYPLSSTFNILFFLLSYKNGSAVSLYFWVSFRQWSSIPQCRKGERKKVKEADTRWKRKKENDRRGWSREGKESGQCSRKLASKSCGWNESRTPPSPLEWRPQPTTIFSRPFPLGPASRWGRGNEKLLRSGMVRRDERLGAEWKAIVDDAEAYGPPHENPRGNFAERTSISCIQWDIGIKRV